MSDRCVRAQDIEEWVESLREHRDLYKHGSSSWVKFDNDAAIIDEMVKALVFDMIDPWEMMMRFRKDLCYDIKCDDCSMCTEEGGCRVEQWIDTL